MIQNEKDPARLGLELSQLGGLLRRKGELLWTRSADWVPIRTPGVPDPPDEHGGGLGSAISDSAIEDAADEAKAVRYHSEVVSILRRLESDSIRLTKIIGWVVPTQPRQLTNRDLLAAQVSAEGWCASCHRNDGQLEPVWAGRYKDACRFCGEYRSANKAWPPLNVVRWRHRHPGKHVPVSLIDSP